MTRITNARGSSHHRRPERQRRTPRIAATHCVVSVRTTARSFAALRTTVWPRRPRRTAAPDRVAVVRRDTPRTRRPPCRRRRCRVRGSGIGAELAEHHADAEAGGHRLAHALAARPRPARPAARRPRRALLEDLAGDRAALAQHQVLRRQPCKLDAPQPRPGMAARHEEDQPVLANAAADQARIGGRPRHHADIGLVVEHLAQHCVGIADAQREGEAGPRAADLRQCRHHVVGRVGADAQMATGLRRAAGDGRGSFIVHGEKPGDRAAGGRFGQLDAAADTAEQRHARLASSQRTCADRVGWLMRWARAAGE